MALSANHLQDGMQIFEGTRGGEGVVRARLESGVADGLMTEGVVSILDSGNSVLAAASDRAYVFIQNIGSADVWLSLSDSAAAGAGIKLVPDAAYEMTGATVYRGELSAVCNSGQSSQLSVIQGRKG